MKERPDLNVLSKEVYEANKAKGFHDSEATNEKLLMLVITELSEAVEADRVNLRANIPDYVNSISNTTVSSDNTSRFHTLFIKDTVEDELADAVIRLLDLAGLRGYNVNRFLIKAPVMDKLFAENIFKITTEICYFRWSMEERVNFAILNIEELCKELQIDLWLHVELKLRYNKTREHKHGKKY